ncbi:MAG: hypothetical protein A2Y38_09205 [Spirochaetes bacterium GWB1_59_5]|nr:MAG: hypothetical protein A2Y38_09205 [Spirochaetes bacterium GWB1_59_5]
MMPSIVTPMRRIKTVSQLEREWELFKTEIQSRHAFTDNGPEAKEARRERGRDDILYFGKTYFAEYFDAEWASFHKSWPTIGLIKDEPTLVAALRGAGKSTFFGFLRIVHAATYGTSRYAILGAYDHDRACLMTARVLLELLYNPKLAADFGPYFPTDKKPGVGFFVAQCPCDKDVSTAIQAISIGQNPRGMIWGAYRPDLVVLDDIQSDKRARSKKWVAETLDWIFRGLVPALRSGYFLTILATYLHTKCVASLLRHGGKVQGRTYQPIKSFEFPAQEGGRPDGRPTWPAVFSLNRLKALKTTIGSLIYNQEYLLIAISEEGSIFPEEWIKYYVPGDLDALVFDAVLTRIDPASKDAKTNCKKAVITAGIASGVVYVRAAWIRNQSVAKMIDAAYQQYDEHNSYRVTYEDNGGHALLSPLFDAEAEKRGYALPIRAWTEHENKIQRTEQILSADVESGRIRFLKDDSDQVTLVEELVDFPTGDLDGPDCLAGLVRDLKEIARNRRFTARGGRRRESYEITRGYV